MAATLPFIVICYEWLCGREKAKLPSRLFNRYTLDYMVITLFYIYLRFYLFHNPEEQLEAWSLVERFLTLPWLIVSYIKLSLFPVQLSADYVINPVSSPFSSIFILSIIALVSIFIIIFLYSSFNKMGYKRFPPLAKGGEGGFENGFSRQRSILFGAVFFLITLIPVYSIVPIGNPFAERYLYLPVAGFILFAVLSSYPITEKFKMRPESVYRYVPMIFLVVLIIFSFSVVKRNTIWKDNYSLWFDTVAKMPNSSLSHTNLGIAYCKQGRCDEGIREYLIAIKLRFDYAIAHYNLGLAYMREGRYDEAIYELKKAISFKPDYSDAYINLGITYSRQGLLDQAIKEYLAIIRLKPDDALAHYNLGIAYYKQGRYDEAINEFTAALKLKPDDKEAYQNIRNAYEKKKGYKGRPDWPR